MINLELELQLGHSENSAKALWEVPPHLTYFQGHFPEQPVLPAVGIIDVTMEVLKKHIGKNVELSEIEYAKFMKPVTPLMTVQIYAQLNSDKSWNFLWKCNGELLVKLDLLVTSNIES